MLGVLGEVDSLARLIKRQAGMRERDNIDAAGDAIKIDGPSGSHLRMGCAVAGPLGGHAAETALALL